MTCWMRSSKGLWKKKCALPMSSPWVTTSESCGKSRGFFISPNTSGASPPRASRGHGRILAAPCGIRPSIGFAIPAWPRRRVTGIPAPPAPSNETRRPAVPMPGNPPLSLFDARFLLAHGHFIAVPNELIGDPGVDVDDREHQIAEDEEQGHAPREMPPVQTREKRFRTVPGERYAERRGGHVYIQHRSGIGSRQARQRGSRDDFRRIIQRVCRYSLADGPSYFARGARPRA